MRPHRQATVGVIWHERAYSLEHVMATLFTIVSLSLCLLLLALGARTR